MPVCEPGTIGDFIKAVYVERLLWITAATTRRTPGLRGLTTAAAAIGLLQVFVGILNVVLGLPVAQYMDGRVMLDIVDPDFLRQHPLRVID